MSSRRGSFADLVALAERAGQSEVLPALALAGVRSVAELAAACHLGGPAGGTAVRRGDIRPGLGGCWAFSAGFASPPGRL